MPRSKPCPKCGELAEVKTYLVTAPSPVILGGDPRVKYANPTEEELVDLDVWECGCGWAEDVEP
jgi:hypothetical protein